MRKYRGTSPTAVAEVDHNLNLIETNDGARYFVRQGKLPQVGEDIFDHRFERAQPMTFTQYGTHFKRVMEGDEWPFADYLLVLGFTRLERLESEARTLFIEDMAKQNIYARFR